MANTITLDEDEARALLAILQTLMMELRTAKHALEVVGQGDSALCSDDFAGQVYQALTELEGDVWKANLPQPNPEAN